jgi:hypothetical protein
LEDTTIPFFDETDFRGNQSKMSSASYRRARWRSAIVASVAVASRKKLGEHVVTQMFSGTGTDRAVFIINRRLFDVST